MISSLSRKLIILSCSTIVLFVLIASSLSRLYDTQKSTQSQLERLVQLQVSVDQLRSQLWVFLQYSDLESLKQIDGAQKQLEAKLTNALKNEKWREDSANIANLKRMNQSLYNLVTQERNITGKGDFSTETYMPELSEMTGRDLLHSRYNMLVQNMTEELLFLQRRILETSLSMQRVTLIFSAVKLLVFSAIVGLISFFIYSRFKRGYNALRMGFFDLGRGKLETKVSTSHMDSEFVSLTEIFNQMKDRLKRTTISRNELQEEVEKQTQLLQQQKQELIYLSERDGLTSLYNRRAFERLLEQALIKAARSGLKLSLLFLDLNDFKQINDTIGHDAGDEILKMVAKRINHHIRQSDFACRLGGDEFVVCLDLLEDFDGVAEKIERLRQHICEPCDFKKQRLCVGVSVGVSRYPDDGQTTEQLLRIADKAMYSDKNGQKVKQLPL